VKECEALCERNKKVRRHSPRVLRVSRLTLLQITVVNDNKRAQSVIISGATGPNAPSINGFFDPTSEIHEDRVRYCKRGDAGVCIEHFKTHNGTRRWQIKRASAKGTDSALIWTGGGRALEACRSSEWHHTEGKDIKMIGVKLRVQEDAEDKVRCMFKLQPFFSIM
jgi:branched-subunit amino acid aminotransferase/4-amino-4-deoxychorismate lyase